MSNNQDAVLPYLWHIRSVPRIDVKTAVVLEGGGICIDPNGFVLTVTHGLKPKCRAFDDSIVTGRNYEQEKFRDMELVKIVNCKSFGLSLYKVAKEKADEKFEVCPPLSDTIKVELGAKVFMFAHEYKFPRSLSKGRVCYPFRGQIHVHDESENFSIDDSDLEPRSIETVDEAKMDIIVSSLPDYNQLIGEGLDLSFYALKPSMPLIQVQGFAATTLDGQCGCPIFTNSGNELIGLLVFSTGFFQFLIPTPVLREFCSRNSDIFSAPQAKEVGQGSGSNERTLSDDQDSRATKKSKQVAE